MSDGPRTRDARDGHVWYFAYGSNLAPEIFEGRRRMRPASAIVACAHGRRLTFDLPIGPGERGVANLRADPDAVTWGVAYEVAVAQCAWLDRTEGVPAGAYARVALEVIDPDGVVLPAFTYAAERGGSGRKPSPRYMGLILAGARHHALPDDWIAVLASYELAKDEREDGVGT